QRGRRRPARNASRRAWRAGPRGSLPPCPRLRAESRRPCSWFSSTIGGCVVLLPALVAPGGRPPHPPFGHPLPGGRGSERLGRPTRRRTAKQSSPSPRWGEGGGEGD